MEDVTEEVTDADITVNIDISDETSIPPSLLELGLGVTTIQDQTGLRVTSVEMDTDGGHPPQFRIEGAILTDY